MPTGDDVEVQQPSVPTSGPRPGSQTRSRRRRGRLLAIVTVVLMVVGVVLLLGPFAYARANVSSHLHDSATGVSDVPAVPVAIVFGAGLTRAGTPSPFLAQRIDVAVELYRAKKVRALLMSGDNSRADYDEVGAMSAQAQRLGVPAAAIVTDHAGFDTYSSCYRARYVWGITRAVVISQPFHLTRAVWTCRHLGVDAEGAATISSYPDVTRSGWVREIPAIDKAIVDVVRNRKPRFPGPREHALDAITGSR